MKYTHDWLNKNALVPYKINEKIIFDEELIKSTKRLLGLSEVEVSGTINYLAEVEQTLVKIKINCIMDLECARTLALVHHPFEVEDEIIFTFNKDFENDDVEYVKGNTIDLAPYIWEIIFSNIPMRVVAENSDIITSGDGWEIISEDDFDDYKEEMKKKIDPRLESLKKYFDK